MRTNPAARAVVGAALLAGIALAGYALAGAVAREGVRVLAVWLTLTLLAQLAAAWRVLRGHAGSWRSVRAGTCLLVIVWFACLALFTPYARLAIEVALASAAGVYGACVALDWPRPPRRRVGRVAETVAFNLCVAALLAELALAGLARVAPSPLLTVENAPLRRNLTALARAPGSLHMGFPVNSGGHYDVEFVAREHRSRTTAAMIGDSFSASFVPHRYHFTTVAERALDGQVEVYNFGIPGLGPHEYLHLMVNEVAPLEPDAVLIGLFCGNDLGNLRPPRGPAPWLWPWFDPRQVRLLTVPRRAWALAAERARGGAVSPAEPVGGGSATALDDEEALAEAFPWLHDHALERGTFSETAYLELVRRRIVVACAPTPGRLATLFDCMDAMRHAAGDLPFGVVLLPAEFQVEDALWQRAVAELDAAALDRDEPQRSIAAGLAARGIPFVDLLPVLRAQPALDDDDRHLYLLCDTHFNVRGNDVAGREIASFVRRLLSE